MSFQKGNQIWKGRKHSEDTKKKIALKALGNTRGLGRKHSAEAIQKIKDARTGKPRPELRGVNNPNWRGGTTPAFSKIRASLEYKMWRRSVFERDNYTCVWCLRSKDVSGKLNADHIKPFAYYPELRFAIDNGRTLCLDCHKKTDTYLFKSRHAI